MTESIYYDEPYSSQQRSVVELFEESSDAQKELADNFESPRVVRPLHPSKVFEYLVKIFNGNIFPIMQDYTFMNAYVFFKIVWLCDPDTQGLPEIVYKVVDHNKLSCGREWGSEGLYIFLQTIDHVANLPKNVWGNRSARGNRMGRQKDPIPDSEFKNKRIIIKLLELAVEISEMMVQGKGSYNLNIAACANMDLWMEDNTRVQCKERHDELRERLKNPAPLPQKARGLWERIWGGNG